MSGFFRYIFIHITGLFYKLIPTLYDVLYDLAGAKFFTDDVVQKFSNNIYILVSVAMLFTFGVQLLKAIVNPDLLFDNKKGTSAFLKRALLSVVIVTAIPIIFNALYELQNTILENSLVEKLITGYNGNRENLKIGQYLSAVTISELLKPEDDAQIPDGSALSANYDLMLNKSVDNYYDKVAEDINLKYTDSNGEEKPVLHYEMLAMLGMGIFICYFLITSCMDIALRMVKLSFLEMIAPISIVAYLMKGDDSIQKWAQEVGKTYALVFVKLAALSILVFGIQSLPEFLDDKSYSHPWVIKMLVIIGLLTLANEIPNLVQSLFGISFQYKGGIKGRLGNMIGPAAQIAQKAWGTVSSGIAKGAKGVATAGALGVAGAAGWGAKQFDKHVLRGKGSDLAKSTGQKIRNIKNSNGGRQVGRVLSTAGSTIKSGGGLKGLQEGYKTYKENPLTKDSKLNRLRERNDEAAAANANAFGIDMNNKRSSKLNGMMLPNQIDGKNKTSDQLRKEQLEQQQARISVASEGVNGIEATVKKLHLPKGVENTLLGDSGYVKTNWDKKVVDEIMNSRKKVSDGASQIASNLTNSGDERRIKAAENLRSLNIDYEKGNISSSEYAKRIKEDFVDQGLINKSVAEESITKHIDNVQSLINTNKTLLQNAASDANVSIFKTDANGNVEYDKLMSSTFGVMSGNVDRKATIANEEYEKAKKEVENDAILSRDISYTEANIGRVLDDYVLEAKGNKYEENSAATILSQPSSSSTQSQTSTQQSAQNQTSQNGGYGPEYYPNSYDDFDNYNSQPRAPRPESTGTGAPQPEPTPISNASTPVSDNSTPERVVEREVIRENNTQNSNGNPQSLDGVTINASNINTDSFEAKSANINGLNNNAADDTISDRLKGQFDELLDQHADRMEDAMSNLGDRMEDASKKDSSDATGNFYEDIFENQRNDE